MKFYHFACIFFIVFICSATIMNVKSDTVKAMVEEKAMLDEIVESAIHDGVGHLISMDELENIVTNCDKAFTSFLLSLYSNMNLLSFRGKQEIVELYIPVCTINVNEGFYCSYYHEFINEQGETETTRVWSELLPYVYEDEDFVYRFTLSDGLSFLDKNNLFDHPDGALMYQIDYHDISLKPEFEAIRKLRSDSFLLDEEAYELVKKRAILDTLEQTIAYYTTHHNRIAEANKIGYEFCFPHGSIYEWADYLDDVSMLVVFQGYPFENGLYTYNRVVAAGAYVKKQEDYFVEEKSWYKLYHKAGCIWLEHNANVEKKVYSSPKECIEKGCYACEDCCYTGAYAPELSFHQ